MMATHILLHPFMFCNLLVPFLLCPPSSTVFDMLCICGYRPDQPAVFVCCFFSHQLVRLVVSGVSGSSKGLFGFLSKVSNRPGFLFLGICEAHYASMQIWHRDSLKWLSVWLQPSFFFFLLIIHILRWRRELNLEPVMWWMCFSFRFFCFAILYHVLIRFIVQLIVHSPSVTHHSYVTTHYSSHLLYYVLLPLASTDYQDSSFLKLLLSFLFSFVMYKPLCYAYFSREPFLFCTCTVDVFERSRQTC